MAHLLATFALYAGVALADGPLPKNCPEEIETITTTATFQGTWTVSDYSTVTDPRETQTYSYDSYNATATITADGTETTTLTLDTTSTSTVVTANVYTYICDNTVTASVIAACTRNERHNPTNAHPQIARVN